MNKPPFEITDHIINIALEINNKLGKLEINLGKKKNLYLRKASKIKSVNSSCAIEQNPLSEEQVEGIVNGKRIIAPPEEILEVKNAYNTYVKIGEYHRYDVTSFLHAHRCLMQGLVVGAGEFRTTDVAVYEGDKVIHVGARPQFVSLLMEELFEWGQLSELNPLIKACIMHYEIETIHPFSDGNGRIGRLWQSVILYDYNKLFEFIPIETLVYENQQAYYNAIEISRRNNSSTIFIEFMLEMISKTIDSLESMNPIVHELKEKYLKNLTKNEKEILEIIVEKIDNDDYINIDDLKEKANKASSTIRNCLKKLTVEGIIIATGQNKGRKYKLNHDILL